MSDSDRSSTAPMAAAGLLGLTGIGLGAFGAHALKATLLERGTAVPWETGVKYHLLHAIALLALAAWARAHHPGSSGKFIASITWFWVVGVTLFSGSLYWLALGGPRWLGPVTPFGGVALMAGWLFVTVAALRRRE